MRGTSRSVLLYASYRKKHVYNGLGPGWEYEILGLKELVGAVHASGSAVECGTSNLKLSCKTLYLYLSYKKIRTVP